jgi:hypothetical protein
VGKMFAGGCVSSFHFKTYSVRRRHLEAVVN